MRLSSVAKALLSALDRPAVLIGPEGGLCPNAGFEALPAPVRARALSKTPPAGWTSQAIEGGLRIGQIKNRACNCDNLIGSGARPGCIIHYISGDCGHRAR